MKVTYQWLKRHLTTTANIDTLTATFNKLGLVVDDSVDYGAQLKPFVIAEVRECGRHPDADRLSLCQVFDGTNTLQVVCGAPNVRKGLRVVLAHPGAVIPASGQTLKKGMIRGVESQGMLCSFAELNLGADHDGIVELPADAPVGQSFAVTYGYDDVMFDLDIAPNRGDCLGVAGVVRELAVAGVGQMISTVPAVKEDTSVAGVKVTIDPATKAYGQWRRIIGVSNKGSAPAWMQRLLTNIGSKTISPAVDVTNFLCFDQGQPFHAFDAAKVRGDIQVRFAKSGEQLEALNGETYTLTSEMVVIADNDGAIALAGVIGGQRTACDADTQDIILECAYFDPILVARAGRALNINTDSRYRFERRTDAYQVTDHMSRATVLMQEIISGRAGSAATAGQLPTAAKPFEFALSFMQKRAGIDVPADQIKTILTNGGCKVQDTGAGKIQITSPTWRQDLERPEDVVEEVLRFVGYDTIPVVMLPRTPVVTTTDLLPAFVNQMFTRQVLAQRGLAEVVTWSFMRADYADMLGGAAKDLHLTNPISTDLAVMRPGLIVNLVEAAVYNFNRGQQSVTFFEVGPQYGAAWPQGQTVAAAGLRGGVGMSAHWVKPARSVDTFDAKADVWELLRALGIDADKCQLVTTDVPAWYHPGRAGVVRQGPQRVLAYFGEIHPAITAKLGCDKPVVGFEVFLENLPAIKWAKDRKPWQISPFQPVERDFSFVLQAGQTAEAVIKTISKADPTLITRVDVFDVYPLKDGTVALGIRVRLEPQDRTLTEADLQALADKVITSVTKQTGAVLRT